VSITRLRPDVLVLGAGGVLGEAWMAGVLAGIEDAIGVDLRDCDYYVGTSAGAIVASRLAVGRGLARPASAAGSADGQPEGEQERAGVRPAGAIATARAAARRAGAYSISLSSPLAPLMLDLAAPGGAVLRGALLRAAPRPSAALGALREEVDSWGADFDGRLRIVAVRRSSGRRVVFGAPGAPDASVAAAVEASCAVPWLFAPVMIGGQEYVDGGVWSATNIDVAPAGLETQVLCLAPTAGVAGSARLGAVRRAARSAALVEALALRRRGAAVRTVAPDAACATAIGPDLMDRSRRDPVHAAGYRQGVALAGPDSK
jgi:NTE family protein